ncbi:hypothetical protein PVAND_005882 [Polypedilum vanderplanki]|uniref:Uncharacterized protein n=1 Tax=Polypedilum vanderplanki TaxID=319348 RepID=A0A9J6C2J4_POLVA|nr:hypothetical protein PVAND_005882 [Polypedilum vanderplanki]
MKLLTLTLVFAFSANFVEMKRSVGAPSKVDKLDGVEGLLNDHINKLNLTTVRLIDVQQQVVSGILYKFNGIFKNTDGEFLKGDIELWLQDWLENESERVKISIKNQVKLENFDENSLFAVIDTCVHTYDYYL